MRDELEALYQRVAPALYAEAPGFPGLTSTRSDDELAAEIAGSDLFGDISVRTYSWSSAFNTDTFVELLLTQSNHRLRPENERTELLDAVRTLIARHRVRWSFLTPPFWCSLVHGEASARGGKLAASFRPRTLRLWGVIVEGFSRHSARVRSRGEQRR